MKTKRPISKRVIERFLQENSHWSVNDAATILTGDFATRDYISGLLLVSKIIVLSNVYEQQPVCSIHKQKVTVKISVPTKLVLSDTHFSFAEKISSSFLSTKKR